MGEENKRRDKYGRTIDARGENDACGTYTPAYREMIRKREEILSRLTNGVDRYQAYALWQKVVDAMARGADPLQIIEQLMVINISQAEQIMKMITYDARPLSIPINSITWQPVEPGNLPNGITVLARNKDNVLLGGLVETIDSNTGIACVNEEGGDTIWLDHVTHYITFENLLKL